MARSIEGPWFRASKRTWYATVEGRSVSLKVKGEGKEKEAVKAWHRLLAEEPKAKEEAKAEKPSVKEVVDAFLADAAGRLKPTTVRIYRYDLSSLCTKHGTLPADELSVRLLSLWLLALPVNSTTKGITLRSVSSCFGWAVRNDILPFNPCLKVSKPKSRSRSREALISEADHAKLLEAASPDFRIVLRVLHGTGCRPTEACRITTDTFFPDAGCVVLAEHKADANGKPRVLYLTPELVDVLKAQAVRYGSGSLLRSRKGKAWTQKGITQRMRHVKAKAGVKAIAYGYRHTYATEALAKGIPDATVAALLGHSSTAMLHKHYSHLGSRADILRAAAAQVHGR